MRRPRFTIRGLMIAVAMTGLLFAVVRHDTQLKVVAGGGQLWPFLAFAGLLYVGRLLHPYLGEPTEPE